MQLGEWVHRVRWLWRRGLLPPWAKEQLDAMGFEYSVDVITAKWFSNFHAARHYKVGCDPGGISVERTGRGWVDGGRGRGGEGLE
jgi:hypothetical protein